MAINQIPSDLVSETLTFDCKTPVTKVIPELRKYPAVIISKNKLYYGIVDTRTIYRSKQNLKLGKDERIERFATRVPKITDNTSIDDLIYYFYRAGVKALPYYDGKRITGVLERTTLLKMMLSLGLLKDMKVNEAMTTPVLAIDVNASLTQAKAAMRENKVNRLVALDNNKFVGLVTNYDIVQDYTKIGEKMPILRDAGKNPLNVIVQDIMEKNPRSIDCEKSLSDAVRELVENKISSVLVFKKGIPIGMLTVTDVLESVVAKKRIEERRIFISGLDADSYQYSDDIREELKSFMARAEKLSGVNIDYVTFRVKRVGNKAFEIQVRLSLGKIGIISMNTTMPEFHEALTDIMYKLREKLMKEKSKMLTISKISHRPEEM